MTTSPPSQRKRGDAYAICVQGISVYVHTPHHLRRRDKIIDYDLFCMMLRQFCHS